MEQAPALERIYRLYNSGDHGGAFAGCLDLVVQDPSDFQVQSIALSMLKNAGDEGLAGLMGLWLEASGFGNLANAAVIVRDYFEDPQSLYLASGVLGCLAIRIGRPDDALALFANCLSSELPDPMEAAAVTSKYQDGAACYDDNPLHRRSVEAFADFLRRSLDPAGTHVIVDVPCGTGQAGDVLRARARTLIGCDLSANMVERARGTGVYDRLLVGDMLALLPSLSVDMVFSHGSLYYFRDLGPVVAAAAAALRPGGFFALTDYPAPQGLMATIGGTLRYCRSPELLCSLMAEHGLVKAAAELGVTYGLPCGYWLFRKD